ncbi:TolC family protein [Arcicella aquatica]|uniref:TolC family protein n=1 Tax=Arcicella aquatica TaxID=217141 RepID=A0ABU5QHG8_9BACT|nr:TolC family protein [Arcicella aquatica]MEA5256473.1 TolC family protein [Arcicella aquatica]
MMIKLKYYILTCGLFMAMVFTNCQPLKTYKQPSLKPMPESYNNKKDSTNDAAINWKSYFTDTTLIALIDTSLNNNIDLLMTLQRIEMAQNQLNFAKVLGKPFVGAGISAGQKRFGKYTMDGVGNYDTNFSNNITNDQKIPEHLPDFNIGLQSSWEIDIWGKLRNKKKAAIARYLASVEGKNWIITNLISEISAGYYSLIALDNELDIIKETRNLQLNELQIIQAQKEAGYANELAVKQFESRILNTRSLEVEILQSIIEIENKINFLLGRYPQPIYRDKLQFTKPLPTQIRMGVPAQLLRNRPDVKKAEYELLAAKADVEAARLAFYPSLNINATLGFQTFNPAYVIAPQSLAYNVLGGLSAPIINRKGLIADFGVTSAVQIEALYNYQKSIIGAYTEVYNEMSNIKNLSLIQDLKSKEVNVLTESIVTSTDLFKTGRATYLEVLLTQANALQARIELINVKKRQYDAVVNIYKALGGGWR